VKRTVVVAAAGAVAGKQEDPCCTGTRSTHTGRFQPACGGGGGGAGKQHPFSVRNSERVVGTWPRYFSIFAKRKNAIAPARATLSRV
jgi:hypothetical protein